MPVQVIKQTADFVRSSGGQLEVLLRVKQGGNPLFGFLLPADRLHPFYRWLVETRPQDLVVIDAAPPPAPAGAATVGVEPGDGAEPAAGGGTQHPAEQWRVAPAEQQPPWAQQHHWQQQQQPAEQPAEQPAAPALEYGPALRPPGAGSNPAFFGGCSPGTLLLPTDVAQRMLLSDRGSGAALSCARC